MFIISRSPNSWQRSVLDEVVNDWTPSLLEIASVMLLGKRKNLVWLPIKISAASKIVDSNLSLKIGLFFFVQTGIFPELLILTHSLFLPPVYFHRIFFFGSF